MNICQLLVNMDLFKSLLNEMDEDTLHTLTMKASNK